MRVAAHLDIPFITLDLEKEYKKEVVDYMIDEYKCGRTPNPDVMCNRYVKFGGFYDWAMKQGADFVATGHYAQTRAENVEVRPLQWYVLLKGEDKNKDQSYFLWMVTGEQFSKTLFPVGNIEKPEVRKLAKKFKLPNAEKRDSQGLCFIGSIDMKEFLKHFINEERGNVLDEQGEVIGHHEGSIFYTIGERHGFTITKKTPDDAPYFITKKSTEQNTITVSHNKKAMRKDGEVKSSNKINLKDTNWISNIPEATKTYQARVRYRGELYEVKIETKPNNGAEISFVDEGDTVAPGQSVVVYDGMVCVGGGIAV
jgi:tRNA-specific 2-thiouridylase